MQRFVYTSVYIHESMVEYYASTLAAAMDIDNRKLSIAAFYHDYSKLKWPIELFSKARNELTDTDLNEILMHPKKSVDHILNRYPERKQEFLQGDPSILDLIFMHHEKPDGSGYYNIKDMPIDAVLLSIADIFDACLSDRLYRKSLNINIALFESLKDYSSYLTAKKYNINKIKKALVKSAVAIRLQYF
ncbi:MAG: HD domain-containing protein [Candidatus Anstonellales archaeon]